MNHPAKTKWMAPPAALAALRYGLALVSVAASLGLNHAFLHFHLPQPFTAFVLATFPITFWYDGIAPGFSQRFSPCLSALIFLNLRRTHCLVFSMIFFLLFDPLTTQYRHA